MTPQNNRQMKSILMDVMVGNHYECQIEYPLTGRKTVEIDGNLMEVIDENYLHQLIETKKPSLKYKDYHVEFTDRKIM